MFRRGGRPAGENKADRRRGELTNLPFRRCPLVRRKTARTIGGLLKPEESVLHRNALRSAGNAEAGSFGIWQSRTGAAPPENAEGNKAPGEAPRLACPAANPPGERKRADDPQVIVRGGAPDGDARTMPKRPRSDRRLAARAVNRSPSVAIPQGWEKCAGCNHRRTGGTRRPSQQAALFPRSFNCERLQVNACRRILMRRERQQWPASTADRA